jgi:SNF2 family DNA or RNA helicase
MSEGVVRDAASPCEDQTAKRGVISGSLLKPLNRMQVTTMLLAAGSHPLALAPALHRLAEEDERARPLVEALKGIGRSAKEERLFELLRKNRADKTIIFANFRATIRRLSQSLDEAGIAHGVFSGEQSLQEKQMAVDLFRHEVPVLLCSDSGGEGHNLQFASTLINFDLPWNPMRIEQRVGRVHRIGQTREVFIFNLCTAGSLEQRVLRVLNDKIRMFELVVGEVGSILGNLEQGEEFESLVLNLWLKSRTPADMDAAFEGLGESLVAAQEEYVQAKVLDEALFGEDYE